MATSSEPCRRPGVGAAALRLAVVLVASLPCASGLAVAADGAALPDPNAFQQPLKEHEEALRPLDIVSLKVGSWSAVGSEMAPLDLMEGEYRVGASGGINLPIVGVFTAGNSTPAELGAKVAEALRQQLGISGKPYVSVQVVEYAPVYVVGNVEKPGELPWHPGLTVMQAVALAGGPQRSQTIFSRSERDAVSALGEHHLLRMERWRNAAELARLTAEFEDQDDLEKPELLEGVDIADQLLEMENEIMRTSRDDHLSAVAAIADLKTLLQKRIEKLEEELALREALVADIRQEQASMETLAKKGLAANSRVNEVSRLLAEIEARVLELETAILGAQQQVSEAERDEIELKGARRVKIINELQAAQAEARRLGVKLETAESLYAEATRFGATLSKNVALEAGQSPQFLLTTSGVADGSGLAVEVGAGSLMIRGDILEVRSPGLHRGVLSTNPIEAPVTGQAGELTLLR